MEYDEVLELIETFHLLTALDQLDKAKANFLSAIKLLNTLSDKSTNTELLNDLSQYCLNSYDVIMKGTMTTDDKIIWLNSKLHETYFYPLIKFGQTTSSVNINPSVEDNLDLPDNAILKDMGDLDWTTNKVDMENLYQDMLSNCSYVSSLLSIVHSNKVSNIYEIISPKGPSLSYNVQLTFNGCVRKIPIDNKLPVVEGNRSLIVKSSSNPKLLWPALIEKAYLKIMGQGYKFEGSNMARDTYILTGFIPEIVRICNGSISSKYDALITKYRQHLTLGIGTGMISDKLSKQTGYISNHDYIILQVSSQTIDIKNPWLNSNLECKVIQTDKNQLFQFAYLYINWDLREIFQYKASHRFIYLIKNKPQFSMINNTNKSQEVWIFLERFFSKLSSAMISLEIYETEFGDRIQWPNQYSVVNSGVPTNSENTLIRFTLEPEKSYTVLINCSINISMSLNIYSDFDLQLKKARVKYPDVQRIQDEWDFNNCGGSHLYSTYLENPQFNLEVKNSKGKTGNMYIVLESSQVSGFQMFYWSRNDINKGIRDFNNHKVIVNEAYKSTTQATKVTGIETGVYRIVCGCDEPGKTGLFKLSVYCENGCFVSLKKAITSIGLFIHNISFEWNQASKHKTEFRVNTFNNQMTVHIQYSGNNFQTADKLVNYRPQMRGSIYKANGDPILINKEWNNSIFGIFLDCNIESPGTYILLIERFESGSGSTEVKIGCNNKVVSV